MTTNEINNAKKFVDTILYVINQLEENKLNEKEKNKFIDQLKTLNEYASSFNDILQSNESDDEPEEYDITQLFKKAFDNIKTQSILYQYA